LTIKREEDSGRRTFYQEKLKGENVEIKKDFDRKRGEEGKCR